MLSCLLAEASLNNFEVLSPEFLYCGKSDGTFIFNF